MNTIDFIRASLEGSKGWAMGLLEGIKDAPLTAPTPRGGNHPHWVLAHLIYSEASMVEAGLTGKPNPLEAWDSKFGMGSTPDPEARGYPPFEELLQQFEKVRARTLEVLATMTPADLDKPSKAPEEMRSFLPTNGKVFEILIAHPIFHAGQVADARRALGRSPVMG